MKDSSMLKLFTANLILSLIWIYSLSQTEIGTTLLINLSTSVLSSGLSEIFEVLFSLGSILFHLVLPLSLAIIGYFLADINDQKKGIECALIGSSPFLIAAVLTFSWNYLIPTILMIIGVIIASIFISKNKDMSSYSIGSSISKYVVITVAIGLTITSYLSTESNKESYMNMTSNIISDTLIDMMGGGEGSNLREQLNNSEFKETYINALGSMVGSVFEMMSRDEVVDNIINSSINRGDIVAWLALSDVEFNDSPSVIADTLFPLIKTRTKEGIINYFNTAGNALTLVIKEEIGNNYDTMVEDALLGNDSLDSSEMIKDMVNDGPLTETIKEGLAPGIAFLLFSLITLIGSVIINPLTGLYLIVLSKKLKTSAPPKISNENTGDRVRGISWEEAVRDSLKKE